MPGEKRRKTLTSRRLYGGGLRAAIDAPKKTSSGISSAAAGSSELRGPAQVLNLQVVWETAEDRVFVKSDFVKTCQNPVGQLGGLLCGTFVKCAPARAL
jgi:hypothetical protein